MIFGVSDTVIVGLLGPISTAVVALLAVITVRLGTVHKLVNSQKTDLERYQAVLILTLRHAGIEVPDDPSGR